MLSVECRRGLKCISSETNNYIHYNKLGLILLLGGHQSLRAFSANADSRVFAILCSLLKSIGRKKNPFDKTLSHFGTIFQPQN